MKKITILQYEKLLMQYFNIPLNIYPNLHEYLYLHFVCSDRLIMFLNDILDCERTNFLKFEALFDFVYLVCYLDFCINGFSFDINSNFKDFKEKFNLD